MIKPDGSPSEGTPPVLSDAGDAELVLRTRSGNSEAFGELWRRHYRSAVTVARSVTSTLDADDLVQESYARIYQSILKGGGPTGSFRAYLFTSIRNTAAAWGRARKELRRTSSTPSKTPPRARRPRTRHSIAASRIRHSAAFPPAGRRCSGTPRSSR